MIEIRFVVCHPRNLSGKVVRHVLTYTMPKLEYWIFTSIHFVSLLIVLKQFFVVSHRKSEQCDKIVSNTTKDMCDTTTFCAAGA
jgi:hypothetical protein